MTTTVTVPCPLCTSPVVLAEDCCFKCGVTFGDGVLVAIAERQMDWDEQSR